MITYVKGDVIKAFLDGEINYFAHGCNIYNTMGSGIAKQVKRQLPDLWQADQNTTKGDRSKLGGMTQFTYYYSNGREQIAFNLYTQATYWDDNDRLCYDAIESCFRGLLPLIGSGEILGIPKIGAGLGLGDWDRIESIIGKYSSGVDVRVYTL